MSEDFAYFYIRTNSYSRYISISRKTYFKTMDVKTHYKRRKTYTKTSFNNKWREIKPSKEILNKH